MDSCQVPLQDNESDHGLFLLHYIHKFVESAPKTMKASDLDGDFEDLGVVGFSNIYVYIYIYISFRLSVAVLFVESRSLPLAVTFLEKSTFALLALRCVVVT